MLQSQKRKILSILNEICSSDVLQTTDWPKAYCENPSNVKAIVLGCDPSNRENKRFRYAFGLEQDERYFITIEENLNLVGLYRNEVFIQNLCQNYFTVETGKNPLWKKYAYVWREYLKKELNKFPNNIPVFLTAQDLYFVLLNSGVKRLKPIEFYRNPHTIPVAASDNYLERPLIPFYRNRRRVDYHIGNVNWSDYKEKVKNLVR